MIIENMIQGKVEVLSYKSTSYETFNVVCRKCSKTYTLRDVKTYKKCRIKFDDGTIHNFSEFFVITKEIEACPYCEKPSVQLLF